jgi:SAM-dependent methyltransferase
VPRGRAAKWDLAIRFSRRYGLDRGKGHVTCRGGHTATADARQAAQADLCTAREEFLAGFGTAGRLRCTVLRWVEEVPHWLRRFRRGPRLEYPLVIDDGRPMPGGELAPLVPGQPVSPLTNRLPDRLLFTTRDTNTGDRRLHRVYYDSAGDAAVVYPPSDLGHLAKLYAARVAETQPAVAPPEDGVTSPYAGYRGGRVWERLLPRVPGPYWWLRRPDFGDATGQRLIGILRDLLPPSEHRIRLLVVGCFEGALLDQVKAATKWQVAGTETNPAAAQKAREKGHTVWETSAQEAFMTLPEGESFDVIFLAGVVEHLQDPLMVLRRLRLLLRPRGLVVLNQPNLDSKLLDLYGPTWCHWEVPYHRVLTGRRGLRRLARLADFRVARVRTHTDPYPATVSAQLNELGLGAVVPASARFSNTISSRGVRVTGWARLLWDWRGKGDYLWAVLAEAGK